MSYRIRFTMPDGRTGLVTRQFATREEAQTAIDRGLFDDALRYKLNATSLAYTIEEVATAESRIRELEAEISQLRDAYDAARQDLGVAKRRLTIAEDLGDAMHRAHPSEDWAGYKEDLAASRQGHAKALEAPGEGGGSGEGEK